MKKTGARPTKGDKKEVRQEMHLTRPPRLEGVVKERMMQPKRKKKRTKRARITPKKAQGSGAQERKDYQLKSQHH